ncbi:hypothetical protein HPB49_021832 [Dermacentor silvarum]|uniref:Uncharacterized protein n=1 Tax=Dermacentor silvarum TaxID=543639 RepID=A0ACB8D801_DERSI|nr:hypothetical protein HPB49_021832 [Dermacentor silvarum]
MYQVLLGFLAVTANLVATAHVRDVRPWHKLHLLWLSSSSHPSEQCAIPGNLHSIAEGYVVKHRGTVPLPLDYNYKSGPHCLQQLGHGTLHGLCSPRSMYQDRTWAPASTSLSFRIMAIDAATDSTATTSINRLLTSSGRRGHPNLHSRLPPLPRNDLKVIIRPREGLNLATWITLQVTDGIKIARQHPTSEHVRTLTVRIDPIQNIAIASTPKEELAMSIRHITTIHLGGRELAVTAYVAALDHSAKGVIHGIPAGTPTEVILNGLYAPGREILHARMLGQTSAAVITFTGKTLPFYVPY